MWLAMSSVTTMDSGIEQKILLGIAMVVMAIVAWRTTGSGLSPKESQEILDTTESVQNVLNRGREE
jgi:ABC-type proline/glycine betaine transport system permease subunit